MKIVRHSAYTVTPWKNGGGITREALRDTGAGSSSDPVFRWRLSVAQIDASGPFSDFAGYRRKMVLLQGEGIRLTFPGERNFELRNIGDLVEFDGGLATHCELLNGGCADLNLIVSNLIPDARVTVTQVDAVLEVAMARNTTTLIFCVAGPLAVSANPEEAATLETWDLGVVASSNAVASNAVAESSGVASSGDVIRLARCAGFAAPRAFMATLINV